MKTTITIYLFMSCLTLFGQTLKSNIKYSEGFRPVDPISYNFPIGFYDYSIEYYNAKYNLGLKGDELNSQAQFPSDTCFSRENRSIYFSDLSQQNLLDMLPNEVIEVSIKETNLDGEINFAGNGITSKNSTYKIVIDYMKYVTVNVADSVKHLKSLGINTNKIDQKDENLLDVIAYARVGVGLRMEINLIARKNKVNIGDLFGIGIAASQGKIVGTLSLNVLGIESKEITSLLPMPSEINQSTIQTAIQSLATIKSKIHDANITGLTPQVISIRSVDSSISDTELIYRTSNILGKETNRFSELLETSTKIEKYAADLFKCPCMML